MPAIEPLALSPRDAADCLSVSKRTVSNLIAAGKIEARKNGTRTLVDVASSISGSPAGTRHPGAAERRHL